MILNYGRCSHGRCLFCGYGRLSGRDPEGLKGHLDDFFSKLEDDEIKVFGSGSFLDERQIPQEARDRFIAKCEKAGVKNVTIESRPEFITTEALAPFAGLELTVAMGLESADDELLKKLDKGYTSGEFAQAAKTVHEAGAKVRTYLLVNPPYAGDIKASLSQSVEYALAHSDSLVLINLLPHSKAPLMKLWVEGRWSFLSRERFAELVSPWSKDPRVETDDETFRFIPAFDDSMKDDLKGVGEWYLTHPHFEVWQDYLLRWYSPPEGKVLILLPCAYKKPYSDSRTHKGIIGKIRAAGRGAFHEVMLSNAGVIPREFEASYPFADYDWNERQETKAVKARYVEVTCERLAAYLSAHKKYYLRVVCFLKHDSESYEAAKKACEGLGIELVNLLKEETYKSLADDKSPLQSDAALADLEEGLRWCLQSST